MLSKETSCQSFHSVFLPRRVTRSQSERRTTRQSGESLTDSNPWKKGVTWNITKQAQTTR